MRQWIYSLFGLALVLTQLAGCQKRVPFNPALAGHFFPLRTGSTWSYQVTYPNGARETISERVVRADQIGTLRTHALVVWSYSGLDGSRALRADRPQSYPAEMNEVETEYMVEDGYISRIANLAEASRTQFKESRFLPQYLWPDREWSNTMVPFEQSSDDILKITQSHRSFLEADDVVVPAGRFSGCIRIETEASYKSQAAISDHPRHFTDWYAADVGLVKTLVSSEQDDREIARIELVRVTKSGSSTHILASNH
jgi:hypothetical protein